MDFNEQKILSEYKMKLANINRLERSHHLACVVDVLDVCHGDLPTDHCYTPQIHRLASEALELLFKLESFDISVSTCSPDNSHEHLYLKEINYKQTNEPGSLIFVFERKKVTTKTESIETVTWNSEDFVFKNEIKLKQFANRIHTYCPILVGSRCEFEMESSDKTSDGGSNSIHNENTNSGNIRSVEQDSEIYLKSPTEIGFVSESSEQRRKPVASEVRPWQMGFKWHKLRDGIKWGQRLLSSHVKFKTILNCVRLYLILF